MTWHDPGVEEVASEVFRVPLPLPSAGLVAVNCYVVRDGRSATLIDPGWDDGASRRALAEALATLGLSPADVSASLVTHLHRDHLGAAVRLRREHGVPIRMGSRERPGLEWATEVGWDTPAPQIAQLRRCGATELCAELEAAGRDESIGDGAWAVADDWLDDGAVIECGSLDLVAVHTPGHTRGHTAFLDSARRFLVTGDTLLPGITPSIGFDAVPEDSPLTSFLGSLATLAELPVMPYLPAHGGVAPDQRVRVEQLLAHHEARLDLMLARLGRSPRTAVGVAREIGWTSRSRSWAELDRFNRMLAVIETDAHLVWACERGLAAALDDAGVRYYAVPAERRPARRSAVPSAGGGSR